MSSEVNRASAQPWFGKGTGARTNLVGLLQIGVKEGLAGALGSIALVANIVSFGALMFPGELSAGVPTAIWAMLIGSSIGGIFIALMTSLPPISTGIDSPTGAFLVLISAGMSASVLSSGASPQLAIQTVMLVFTAATLLSGVLFFALGAARWGAYFRFVPYFVVGGFLAATGWFLIAGGFRLATGRSMTFASITASWSMFDGIKTATSVSVLILLLSIRKWIKSPLAMPIALLGLWLGSVFLLWLLGVSKPEHGWYLRSLGVLTPWWPLEALQDNHVLWKRPVVLTLELLAVTIVALISLVTKVASIEVGRETAGDLDAEFRAHGLGNLVAGLCGGIASSLQIGTSRLLEQLGATSRFSGVVCAIVLGGIALSSFDLPGWIPTPIIAGLIFFLGYTFLVDAFWRPLSQRAWFDILLSIGIMMVCIQYGYLIGVLAGLISACLLFAINYARIGVVRRHATRAQFSGFVTRSTAANDYLKEVGDSIQIYWLTGYIFFGSSESVFERVRRDIRALPAGRVSYVVLDFSAVSGSDSSAILSLTKLRSFCDKQNIILIYCSLTLANRRTLALRGFFGGKSRHQNFENLNVALAWCEERLLEKESMGSGNRIEKFDSWLQDQLGSSVKVDDFIKYLKRRQFPSAEVLYREGETADTIDLIASGELAIELTKEDGERVRVRRLATHTVVGEMGFFRQSVRSATVTADGPATLFTLSREKFEQMRNERPDLASAFDDFIKRLLADRLDFANREVLALNR